jgi:hypothetical protein
VKATCRSGFGLGSELQSQQQLCVADVGGRKMTSEEAINVLAGLRQALKTLDLIKGMQAFHALIIDTRKMTTSTRRAAEATNALQTLRRTFDEIEQKGFRFP